jgi:uncharacterized metal-binding protein
MIVGLKRNRAGLRRWLPLEITDPLDLISVLKRHRIDTVVCGGISCEERELLTSCVTTVIENVACSAEEVVAALEDGSIRPGFGFAQAVEHGPGPGHAGTAVRILPASFESRPFGLSSGLAPGQDCIRCRDRGCLRGERCVPPPLDPSAVFPQPIMKVLEAATDVSSEEERQLCRLAELVYFCLEMRYRRIGIAFCTHLQEPAEILASVLDRSFETVGVCCRIGGTPLGEAAEPTETGSEAAEVPPIACNPIAQARILNQAETDLNVIVGLCMGSDCLFTQESEAPVTTLFVKDRSLANNPIGAVYSEYYLRESVTTPISPPPALGHPAWREERTVRRSASNVASGQEERS